jgi:hypothetical protein
MNKTLLLLLVLAAAAYAQTEFEQTFTQQTGQGGLPEIFSNWRVLSVLAIMTSIVLIGIGYAIGIGMEMPEVKAWAGSELVQAFSNVVIIMALLGTIALLDVTATAMVQTSGLNVGCSGGQSCLGNVSVQYLDQYINAARQDARDVAINAIDAGGWANRRFGIYCTSILCLQVGTSFSIMGYWLLDQDRYGIVFEYYTNLLSSLEAQKFFVQNISFSVGPLLLAMGIVGRSFFFTRKLGGLLIAVAAGIMFFLPGMYVFDWVTLDTTLTGDKAADSMGASQCPAECKVPAPMAVVENGSTDVILGSVKDIYDAFPSSEATVAQQIIAGTAADATPGGGPYQGKHIISCMVVSADLCPMTCRELPYPNSLPTCSNLSAQTPQHCSTLPDKCYMRRFATPPLSCSSDSECPEGRVCADGKCVEPTLSNCPAECKVIPPLNGNCNTGNCLLSRPECRIYERVGSTGNPSVDFNWTPNPPKDASLDQYLRCTMAQDCTPEYDALQSCSYVVPQTGSCTELCKDTACPEVCRVITNDITKLPSICINSTNNQLILACQQCPVGCKVNATYIAQVGANSCSGCDAEKRIVTYGGTMPQSYITGACDIDVNCTTDDRVPIPRNACEQCLFSEESQVYNPPIQPSCTDLCKPPENVVAKSPDKFSSIGAEGLAGTEEIKNVSKLMLPAYALPLFNIVATLVFIKGLSTILGGDIEIPGISKVF